MIDKQRSETLKSVHADLAGAVVKLHDAEKRRSDLERQQSGLESALRDVTKERTALNGEIATLKNEIVTLVSAPQITPLQESKNGSDPEVAG